ncbi:MAG: DUF459 domain-containing protein [Chloroflexi bacterium]|nr:DUF459 domain-containing protein [Chloroflexota bacterium]
MSERPLAPPRRSRRQELVEPGLIYLGLLLSVLVAALLTTGRLAGIARTQTPGPERWVATAVMGAVDGAAGLVGLDRPAAAVDYLLGRDEGPPAPVSTMSAGPALVPKPTLPPAPVATVVLARSVATVAATAMTVAPTPSPAPTKVAGAPVIASAAPVTATRPPAATATVPSPTVTRLPSPTPAPTLAPATGPPKRAVSAEAPLRVLVAGDSFAQPLGYDIDEFAAKSKVVEVAIDTKISSGIALPEYFDWPARLRHLLAGNDRAESVILFLGANDFKVMTVNGKKIEQLTPAWRTEYARRAGEVMDLIGERDAHLYWVGMPVVRESWHNDVFKDINAAIAQEAGKRPWVTFIDLNPLFADAEGKYTSYRPDPRGEMVKVRQDDGIHLTDVGTAWVSARVYEIVQRDWRLPAPA